MKRLKSRGNARFQQEILPFILDTTPADLDPAAHQGRIEAMGDAIRVAQDAIDGQDAKAACVDQSAVVIAPHGLPAEVHQQVAGFRRFERAADAVAAN